MKNLYNEESKKFSDLINELKNLPKINAPENFEYNLMTKIHNKNFEKSHLSKVHFNFFKFFAPSAAVVTVILLFFIFYPQREEIQNQIVTQTKSTDSRSIVSNSNLSARTESGKSTYKSNLIINQVNDRSKLNNAVSPPQPTVSKTLINNQRSISVDDYISGSQINKSRIEKGTIVNEGIAPNTDGFLIEKKTDKQTLERLRAVVDSIKKVQEKVDSLKKAQK